MPATTDLIPFPSVAPPGGRFWRGLARALLLAGSAAGRGGRRVGSAVAWAYRSVDPDVRLHLAELPVVGLSMLMPHPREILPLPDDGARPLVLAHGMGGRPGNFAGLRAYARLLGRRRVYLVDFSGDRTFEQMSHRLRDFIARVLEVNGLGEGARVDLVTHSMAGLVARLALRDAAVAARVATLVTLGSPHRGSHLARYAATAVTLALRPGSELLRELAERAPEGAPRGVRTVAFWSRADVILLPAESACLPGAENIELTGVTHYGYLMAPRCWRAIFEVLACGRGSEALASPLSVTKVRTRT
jgi:triacylglycerol lipase